MKKITSENGYALLVTLLTFTVLMIIGISIWGMIISNSKQIHKTEKDIQSTDLAEMGFVYNYTVINDTYLSLTDRLKTALIKQINDDSSKVPPVSQDYTKVAIEELYKMLTTELSTSGRLKKSDIVALQGDNTFTITQNLDYSPADYDTIKMIDNITFLLDKDNYKIKILFNSSGSTGSLETTKSLKLNFDIKIKSIKFNNSDGGTGSPGGTGPLDLEFEVPKPNITGLPKCGEDITGSCSSLGDETITDNKTSITNSTIYIGGKLEISKDISITKSTIFINGNSLDAFTMDISNSKIHIEGSPTSTSTIKSINSLTNHSLLEVGGNLSTDLDTVDTSFIKVKGDATIHDINKGFNNNSKLIVGGNLTVKTPIKEFNDSFIKVYGDASFANIISSSNSKICVFGTLKEIGNYPSTLKVYTKAGTTEETFKNECGTMEDKVNELEFEWEPSADVEYQYDYN